MFIKSEKPLEDKEYPDEADLAEQEDQVAGLRPCPGCGELIYEDAQKCPRCGQWVARYGQPWRDSERWYVRAGLYLTKTLLINWIFWLILAAVTAVVLFLELLGLVE